MTAAEAKAQALRKYPPVQPDAETMTSLVYSATIGWRHHTVWHEGENYDRDHFNESEMNWFKENGYKIKVRYSNRKDRDSHTRIEW